MADDLKDTIKQNAKGPKQAGAEGVTAQQHPLADQIATGKHLAAKDAVSRDLAKAFTRVTARDSGKSQWQNNHTLCDPSTGSREQHLREKPFGRDQGMRRKATSR
jgi:hypothetical protein